MMDPWSGKRVVILGLARQGKALARFAYEAGASVVVSDLRSAEALARTLEELADVEMELVLGEHPESLLDGADVLAISGSVPADIPLVERASAHGVTVTNDSQEFLRRTPATVIGITGSAGKTTTTALTGAMGRAAGRRTWVGGNIGRPLISDLAEMQAGDLAVQELSSFQLEIWTKSPPIAAVLNITPNHLDRHKTMARYRDAKAHILRYQGPGGVAVLSADDAGARSLQNESPGRVRWFSQKEQVSDGAYYAEGQIWLKGDGHAQAVCDSRKIRLRGSHNLANVLAAVTLADSAGIQPEAMETAISSFTGMPHRLEHVAVQNGVRFVNDSIATAPERALAAVHAFEEPLILLAGGRDKNMVWSEWAKTVRRQVKAVVLFGELAPLLASALDEAGPAEKQTVLSVATLAEAVTAAAELAEPGDVVLLAPGGTSFDAYADFEARGEAFRTLVTELVQNGRGDRSHIERRANEWHR